MRKQFVAEPPFSAVTFVLKDAKLDTHGVFEKLLDDVSFRRCESKLWVNQFIQFNSICNFVLKKDMKLTVSQRKG